MRQAPAGSASSIPSPSVMVLRSRAVLYQASPAASAVTVLSPEMLSVPLPAMPLKSPVEEAVTVLSSIVTSTKL